MSAPIKWQRTVDGWGTVEHKALDHTITKKNFTIPRTCSKWDVSGPGMSRVPRFETLREAKRFVEGRS